MNIISHKSAINKKIYFLIIDTKDDILGMIVCVYKYVIKFFVLPDITEPNFFIIARMNFFLFLSCANFHDVFGVQHNL